MIYYGDGICFGIRLKMASPTLCSAAAAQSAFAANIQATRFGHAHGKAAAVSGQTELIYRILQVSFAIYRAYGEMMISPKMLLLYDYFAACAAAITFHYRLSAVMVPFLKLLFN